MRKEFDVVEYAKQRAECGPSIINPITVAEVRLNIIEEPIN
jgi:hypothetical protein